MKKLILILSLTLLSCYNEPIDKATLIVLYDSQDNVIKVISNPNNPWVQSIDLHTQEQSNEFFGIWHDYENDIIHISSNNYIIESAKDLNNNSTYYDNKLLIPELKTWIDNSGIFTLEIIVY